MSTVVKNEPLHEQIYKLIKKRLIGGFYQPGERLYEAKLAEEFGVSRAPVREAVRMLIQDELLIKKGNALLIFQPTLDDMVEIYLCRQQLEALAARLAAQNINNPQLTYLSKIIEKTKEAWNIRDMTQVLELNADFHETILKASGNRQLISLTSMIRDKVKYLRNCSFKGNVRDEEFIREHELIFEALKDPNGENAELEMRGHINNDLQALISLFKNGR